MARPKKIDQTAEAILSLAEAIKGLEAKFDLLKKTEDIKDESASAVSVISPIMSEVAVVSTVAEAQLPFPFEWRQEIDSLLNKSFEAKVNYRGDGYFELIIFVPKEYSNAKPSHWDLVHEDARFVVLSNALGTVGVREYVKKIVENLGTDIMKKVEEDRLKNATNN